jgi:hypothetical protein
MQLTNSRNRHFIEPESRPTNNLYLTYLAIGANINSDVDRSLSVSTGRALWVFRPQPAVRARRPNALHFGSLLVCRCFLY